MIAVADAVGSGFVASLAQPGGNITGSTMIMPELAGKRLELLREILPKLSRLAFLAYGPDPAHKLFVKQAQDAAQSFKIRFQPLVLAGVEEIDGAFSAMTKERAGAVIVQTAFSRSRTRPAHRAARGEKPDTDNLGWISVRGIRRLDCSMVRIPYRLYRHSATFVDKILKGRKPAELPVEQPMKFEFIVNLKTAKQIGLTIPPDVLARAGKIIK